MNAALAPEQARALLSTLAELSDKLEPQPAPRPETVPESDLRNLWTLPVGRALEDMHQGVEAALKAVYETEGVMTRTLALAASRAPARNAGAWAVVLGDAMRRRLKEDREAAYAAIVRYHDDIRLAGQLAVLAADGQDVEGITVRAREADA